MDEKFSILKQITKWYEDLTALPKMIISVVLISSTFSGYMTIHNNKVIKRYEKANEQQQIRNQLNLVIQFQIRDSVNNIYESQKVKLLIDNTNKKIDSMLISLNEGMQSIESLKKSNKNLKDYLIKNAATKADVLKVIEIFEDLKKN